MVNDYALASRIKLDSQVTIPSSSSTANVAKYIKIGDTEYKFEAGTPFIDFLLEVVEGEIKTEYDLTDVQVDMFRNAGSKPLMLTALIAEGQEHDTMLLSSVQREDGKVTYSTTLSSNADVEFKVIYSEKKATFSLKFNDYATHEELVNRVVASEVVAPTKTATSLKIGSMYWGFGGSGSDSFITFPIEVQGGGFKEEYDLTDEQIEMFQTSGNKILILTYTVESENKLVYMQSLARTYEETSYASQGVDYTLVFSVLFATKKALFTVTDNNLATKSYVTGYVSASETIEPTTTAKSFLIGGVHWGFSGGSTSPYISFTLEFEGGVPKREYNLTDTQVSMFQNAGDKMLLLSAQEDEAHTYFLMCINTRTEDALVYQGFAVSSDISFAVSFTEKKGYFETGTEYATRSYVEEYVVPSATTAPTSIAKSITVNGVAWGFESGGTDECVKKTGDTMTGALVMGKSGVMKGYISATHELGTLCLASPNIDLGVGTTIQITDNNVMIGGAEPRAGLVFTRQDGAIEATLQFNNSDVLTKAYISNTTTITEEGMILDARQGKVLADAVATKQDKLTQMGSADVPIYVAEDGSVQPGNLYSGGTQLTVNGVNKGGSTASVWSPTSGGAAGQILSSSGSSAPTWKTIVDGLSSTATDQPLSANMGKELNSRISSLSTLGRFLSLWDCTTGLPVDNPPGSTTGSTYTYKSGDYYIVSKVGTTNLQPNGDSYVVGTASTIVEINTVLSGYYYRYTGSGWVLEPIQQQEVSFKTLSGAVSDNSALVREFAKYAEISGCGFTGNVTFGGEEISFIHSEPTRFVCVTPALMFGLGSGIIRISTDSKTLQVSGSAFTYGGSNVLVATDIVDSVTTGGTTKALSAEQGKIMASRMPKYYPIPASTTTGVETANGSAILSTGGNLVAIAYDETASKFIINGTLVESGTSVTIGSATLTLTYVTENTYKVFSTAASVFIG